MRVLVTGANGFLGRAVVAALSGRGHAVRAFVRPTADLTGLWSAAVEVVRGDLRSSNDMVSAFADVDALVHLAASVSGDEAEQFASTVVGTERLLEAMTRSQTRRVVLASSFTVYDWGASNGVLSEDTPLETHLGARGGYTTAKVWQERVARRMSAEGGLRLTVLRPGVIWGPGQEYPPGITVPVGHLHLVMGLKATLPLTFVDNCAGAFVFAAEAEATEGGTFNVVDDPMGTSTSRFVAEHLQRSSTPGARIVVPYRLALGVAQTAGLVNRLAFGGKGRLPSVLDEARFVARFRPLRFANEKLTALGWRPTIGFEEALGRTYPATVTHAPHG
jgi:UDP-glucose 4-epimerase